MRWPVLPDGHTDIIGASGPSTHSSKVLGASMDRPLSRFFFGAFLAVTVAMVGCGGRETGTAPETYDVDEMIEQGGAVPDMPEGEG